MFETHLNVRDLDRSLAFYRDVVGLELAYVLPAGQVAFLWVGGRGSSMIGLWAGNCSPNVMRLHTAFRTSLDGVLAAIKDLPGKGVEVLDFWEQPTKEPSVIAWLPAASIFFRDPDGHLLEYLAMIPEEPRPQLGVLTYTQWLSSRGPEPRLPRAIWPIE